VKRRQVFALLVTATVLFVWLLVKAGV